jgi:hypothetical protein
MGMSKSQEHLINERNHQLDRDKAHEPHLANPSARHSEMPVSRQGMNQESDHNKHNHAPKGAPKH